MYTTLALVLFGIRFDLTIIQPKTIMQRIGLIVVLMALKRASFDPMDSELQLSLN